MIKRVYLEITDACNLNCPYCQANKNNHFMAVKDIYRCLDEIKTITPYVYLHIGGEPLLHPFFDDILHYCDEHGLLVQLVTNGTRLSRFPALTQHQSLRKIAVSIHAVDKIKIADDYFITVNKLIEEIALKNQASLELRFVDYENLKGNALRYHQYLQDNYPFTATSHHDSFKIAPKVYVSHKELFEWPDINSPVYECYGTCKGAKEMLGIKWNGDVVICCLDHAGHTVIGSINDRSLKVILDTEKYQKIKTGFANNRLELELCRHCTYRKRFL